METELEAIWEATVGNQLIPKWSSFCSITTDRYEKTVFRKRQLDICYGVNLDVYPIPGISPRIYASRIPRTFPVSGSHTPGSRHRKVSPRQVSPHPFPLPPSRGSRTRPFVPSDIRSHNCMATMHGEYPAHLLSCELRASRWLQKARWLLADTLYLITIFSKRGLSKIYKTKNVATNDLTRRHSMRLTIYKNVKFFLSYHSTFQIVRLAISFCCGYI